MPEAPLVAGVELGGTKCLCILASGPKDIRAEVRFATRTAAETLPAIHELLKKWRAAHPFHALGIASFGPLDLNEASASFGALVRTPKPGWEGALVRPRELFPGMPIGFDTDVNGAALAEARWGDAQGLRSFAYVTIGTGIGVGSIVDGQAVRGLGHSEAGHMRVARLAGDLWPGACRYHGDCVEGLASGPAITAVAGRPAESVPADSLVWDRVAHALAGLAHNLALTIAPQRILFGGSVALGQAQLLPRVRTRLLESLAGYGWADDIAPQINQFIALPGLGSRAGALGAIALGLQALKR
jgi:fructokinase